MFKGLELWLPSYMQRSRTRPSGSGVTDVMFCVCDHFEPLHGADKKEAVARLKTWQQRWPALIEPFRDADGCRPKHTMFYPIEQYDKDLINEIATICKLSNAEVEIHLHHDNDTAETVRVKLERGCEDFARHGLLSRDTSGKPRYGFIHGNWALDNSHPEGLHCGVSDELSVLKATGCYADFTMPSAPNSTQTSTINSIYYAAGTGKPKSHDTGTPARVGSSSHNGELLLVQGPLGLNWEARKFGLLPRIENGDLTGINPPRPDRLRLWLDLGIHVQGQPDWLFIKLHTHGGIPRNMRTLLEDPMRDFYRHLLGEYNDGQKFRTHFVTAREMVNIIHAAEDGKTGNPGAFRDYRLTPPPLLRS